MVTLLCDVVSYIHWLLDAFTFFENESEDERNEREVK